MSRFAVPMVAIALTALIPVARSAGAQDASGFVRDGTTGAPISGAVVSDSGWAAHRRCARCENEGCVGRSIQTKGGHMRSTALRGFAITSLGAPMTDLSAQHNDRERLAVELVSLTGIEAAMERVFKIPGDLASDSASRALVFARLEEFLRTYIRTDDIRAEVAAVYMARFDESQLRDLVAFFRAPVGKLWISETPAISQALAKVMKEVTSRYQTEFMEFITRPPDL